MATITLAANTNVSALSLANDDTIDLAGFELTFDVEPTVTGIQVTTPGTAGTCVFPVACVIPTWDFLAGTGAMIATLPANCEIGGVTGGSIANIFGVNINNGTVNTANAGDATGANGVRTNNGTVTTANGGSVGGANAVNLNNGTVTTANGGSVGNANGINANNGTVTTANGGSAVNTRGINTNNGTVTTANGGSVNGANGINANNGTVGRANGGSNAGSIGVSINNGTCLRAFDNTGPAILTSRGDFKLVIGPEFQTTIDNPAGDLTTIYSIGPLSELATIPAGVQVITLSEGIGTAGFTGIRALSRRLGT